MFELRSQRGTEWCPAQPIMASNPAMPLSLQSDALVGRVAELGSLIWLNSVKRAVLLRSEKFHLFFRLFFSVFLIGSETGTLCFLRLSMLRYVSPLGEFALSEVINRTRSDAASCLV